MLPARFCLPRGVYSLSGKIWQNRILTNGGEFHQQLEQALARYLGVKYVSLFSNGTLALLTAMQTLRIRGEVITTPYSFVATSHSLLWNGLTPVLRILIPIRSILTLRKLNHLSRRKRQQYYRYIVMVFLVIPYVFNRLPIRMDSRLFTMLPIVLA